VPIASLPLHVNEESVRTAGVITLIKKIITRSNKPMLFVKIEDAVASTELLVFPNLYELSAAMWQEGRVVLAQGKISDKDQEVKFLVDKAIVLALDNLGASIDAFKKIEVKPRRQFGNFNDYKSNGNNFSKSRATADFLATPSINQAAPASLRLIFKKNLNLAEAERLKEILAQAKGASKVYFKITRNGVPVIIESGFRIKNDNNLIGFIKKEFADSIEVVDTKQEI